MSVSCPGLSALPEVSWAWQLGCACLKGQRRSGRWGSSLMKSFVGFLLLCTLNPNNLVVAMGWGGRRVSDGLVFWRTRPFLLLCEEFSGSVCFKASEGGSPQLPASFHLAWPPCIFIGLINSPPTPPPLKKKHKTLFICRATAFQGLCNILNVIFAPVRSRGTSSCLLHNGLGGL